MHPSLALHSTASCLLTWKDSHSNLTLKQALNELGARFGSLACRGELNTILTGQPTSNAQLSVVVLHIMQSSDMSVYI